jgi:opacity protein-like surface antigen
MKQLSLLSLAAALVASASSARADLPAPPITTDAPGWYYDISAGGLWLSELSIEGGFHSNFDTGIGANLELGYNLGNGVGIGFDVGYYHADFGSLSGRGLNLEINGDVKFIPTLITAHYDYKLTDTISFLGGIGMGAAYASTSLSSIGNISASASDDTWDLAFQVQAGFDYKLTDSASVGVGYRYVNVGASDLQGHLIQGSLNFRW